MSEKEQNICKCGIDCIEVTDEIAGLKGELSEVLVLPEREFNNRKWGLQNILKRVINAMNKVQSSCNAELDYPITKLSEMVDTLKLEIIPQRELSEMNNYIETLLLSDVILGLRECEMK